MSIKIFFLLIFFHTTLSPTTPSLCYAIHHVLLRKKSSISVSVFKGKITKKNRENKEQTTICNHDRFEVVQLKEHKMLNILFQHETVEVNKPEQRKNDYHKNTPLHASVYSKGSLSQKRNIMTI